MVIDETTDLEQVYRDNVGATIRYEGHAYKLVDVVPHRYTEGVSCIVLEAKDKSAKWYWEVKTALGDHWYQQISEVDTLVELAEQLPA
jgi:hypothetical protein